MNLHAAILAGGRGERFWPLSRAGSPKQLLAIFDHKTLLEATVDRLCEGVPRERIWTVAGLDLRAAILELVPALGDDRCIWESAGRNTAAAIGAVCERILREEDAALLVVPSDHWIPDCSLFWHAVGTGLSALDRELPVVTFGIRPAYPETGYGYIERGPALDETMGLHRAARFHEKPGADQAARYVAHGGFYWNSGIFLFRVSTMAGLLREFVEGMAGPLDGLRAGLAQHAPGMEPPGVWHSYFESAPSISIDNGVMEKAPDVAMVEAGFAWSDLGNWTSWGDLTPADPEGNRVKGDVLALDSKDCILYSGEGGLLAVLGVRDLIVVRVGDATLVCPRDKAQEVRTLVREGKLDGRLRRFFQ